MGRKRNGIVGKRAIRFDRDERKVGLSCRNQFRQRLERRVINAAHVRENRGRLHLCDGFRRVGKANLDHRK